MLKLNIRRVQQNWIAVLVKRRRGFDGPRFILQSTARVAVVECGVVALRAVVDGS